MHLRILSSIRSARCGAALIAAAIAFPSLAIAADTALTTTGGRLINFSALTNVGAGSNVVINGLVVEGAPKTVLIRAIGPGLAKYGVSNTLAQPKISLFSGANSIATNTGWGTAADPAAISATAARVGAFALTSGSGDSALLTTLAPGAYTIQVSGANNGGGSALVEVYDADAVAAKDTMFLSGQSIFRDDTFGSEAFWGDQLHLHQTIAGAALGGTGPGLSAKQALALGLKVDVDRLPQSVVQALKNGQVDLDKPDTTVSLLKLNAVVGVKAILDAGNNIKSMGITCALCHSTVDDSFAAGIGHRLDGWPNRDLDVGSIVAFAPTVKPIADLLQLPEDTIRQVLHSWGPGRYDAILDKDGKAFRPDGKTASVVIPAAFGLAGSNLHTYTGWGSVPYWNAYVAVTEMHGQGTFVDSRLNDPVKFPVAVRSGSWNVRPAVDLVSDKLPALHFYQLSLAAPTPPAGSFDAAAAARGQAIFNGKGKCATCHVPPTYTEPGWLLHNGADVGIDNFHADRSPTSGYRTTPLKGLFTREKRGFYHDGRFADYAAVIDHYKPVLGFDLTSSEENDLVQFLKSL